MKNKPLFAIFLIVFIDLLGFGLILPLLPYYAETFGASDTVIGLLVASYAAAQLIGAPLLGRFSDRWGRRPVLVISLAGTLIGFLLLGFAQSLLVLFLARILDGLTGGNISVAQAYITDVTDESNRAKGLGLVGAAFGLGFILGPATGGVLSQFGFAVPALAAAGLVTINLLMVIFWLPESLSLEQRELMAASERPSVTLAALIAALQRPFTGPLLITRFFFGLAFSIFQTIFSLYALRRFDLDAQQTGFVLAYVGVLSVIVQGGLIGVLTKRFREDVLIIFAVGLMAISLFAWGFAPSVVFLLLILVPVALSGGILNTVISSSLSKAVQKQEVGGLLGLSASLESLSRVVAPTIGGILLGGLGTWSPGVFSAVVLAALFIYVWKTIFRPTPQKSTAAT
ncbi:MAG: MFS transporter [Anaerolineales bacterium]|nr:MFS transporter [Anaerolineales bacterium]